MIDFLDKAFIFSFFATPIVATIALCVGLALKEVRIGVLYGFLMGAIGFFIGVSLGGGFGQTEGWGWGNVGAAILGFSYIPVGFLLGFGIYCANVATSRALGWTCIAASLLFPLAHLGRMQLHPALARSEMDWWQPILVNGFTENSEEDARKHLSEPTKEALNEYLYRHNTGNIQGEIPASTLNLLFDLGINVSQYVPLPSDLAKKIYAQSPTDRFLANNPSTPREILIDMSKSKDENFLGMLASNPNTPQEVLMEISQSQDERALRKLATNKKLPPAIARTLYLAHQDDSEIKCGLARNTNTPVDLLIEMSEKEDVDVLYQLSLNKALPRSQYPLMENRCESIVQAEKAKPDFQTSGVRYNNARLLKENLEKRQ